MKFPITFEKRSSSYPTSGFFRDALHHVIEENIHVIMHPILTVEDKLDFAFGTSRLTLLSKLGDERRAGNEIRICETTRRNRSKHLVKVTAINRHLKRYGIEVTDHAR